MLCARCVHRYYYYLTLAGVIRGHSAPRISEHFISRSRLRSERQMYATDVYFNRQNIRIVHNDDPCTAVVKSVLCIDRFVLFVTRFISVIFFFSRWYFFPFYLKKSRRWRLEKRKTNPNTSLGCRVWPTWSRPWRWNAAAAGVVRRMTSPFSRRDRPFANNFCSGRKTPRTLFYAYWCSKTEVKILIKLYTYGLRKRDGHFLFRTDWFRRKEHSKSIIVMAAKK